jgi:hypothetical protein
MNESNKKTRVFVVVIAAKGHQMLTMLSMESGRTQEASAHSDRRA